MLSVFDHFKIPQRIPEKESMDGIDEVWAYDALVKKYLGVLHEGFVQTLLNIAPASGVALEIGTGTGHIAILFAKYAPRFNVVALDLSDDMLKVAINNARAEGLFNVFFLRGDAQKLPFEPESFDLVFSHNMLHHISHPERFLEEVKRVLKSDGALAIRDLKRLSPFERWLHVHVFGFTYDQVMKRQYDDSIKAAYTVEEWRRFQDILRLKGTRLCRNFLTHVSLLRASTAERPRKRFKLPLSLSTLPRILYVNK